MLWLWFLSSEDSLDLIDFVLHCFACAEKLGNVGPVKKGGQCFCEHIDGHLFCWEVDEAKLAVLNALQNEVDME